MRKPRGETNGTPASARRKKTSNAGSDVEGAIVAAQTAAQLAGRNDVVADLARARETLRTPVDVIGMHMSAKAGEHWARAIVVGSALVELGNRLRVGAAADPPAVPHATHKRMIAIAYGAYVGTAARRRLDFLRMIDLRASWLAKGSTRTKKGVLVKEGRPTEAGTLAEELPGEQSAASKAEIAAGTMAPAVADEEMLAILREWANETAGPRGRAPKKWEMIATWWRKNRGESLSAAQWKATWSTRDRATAKS